jgi:Flp pilus assembly protein CpaB
MTYRIRNIAIAFALAIAGAILTTIYVTNYKRHVQQGEESVPVFVAAQDIPAGTTGAQIAARHLLTERDVAHRNVVPGAISDPSQVEKLVAVQPVYAGEQITLRRVGTKAQQGLRAELTGNQRAIQIPGDANQLLLGTLKPGDRVDVIANMKPDSGGSFSRIVLRNLRVLRTEAPAGAASKVQGPEASASVLLAVRDTQVQKLFFTLQNGAWSLQLRPPVDASDSPEVVETYDTVRSAGLRRTR